MIHALHVCLKQYLIISHSKLQSTSWPLEVHKTVEDCRGQFVIIEHQDFKSFKVCVFFFSRPGQKDKKNRTINPHDEIHIDKYCSICGYMMRLHPWRYSEVAYTVWVHTIRCWTLCTWLWSRCTESHYSSFTRIRSVNLEHLCAPSWPL